jgi:integrase/recombinase XerD
MLQILLNKFDVDYIYRKYKGEDSKEEITILGAYDLHNSKTEKLIGIDFNQLSWSRYVESRRKVALFITKFYKRKDVRLKDLDLKFIQDLEYFFKTVLKLKQANVYRSIQRVYFPEIGCLKIKHLMIVTYENTKRTLAKKNLRKSNFRTQNIRR